MEEEEKRRKGRGNDEKKDETEGGKEGRNEENEGQVMDETHKYKPRIHSHNQKLAMWA